MATSSPSPNTSPTATSPTSAPPPQPSSPPPETPIHTNPSSPQPPSPTNTASPLSPTPPQSRSDTNSTSPQSHPPPVSSTPLATPVSSPPPAALAPTAPLPPSPTTFSPPPPPLSVLAVSPPHNSDPPPSPPSSSPPPPTSPPPASPSPPFSPPPPEKSPSPPAEVSPTSPPPPPKSPSPNPPVASPPPPENSSPPPSLNPPASPSPPPPTKPSPPRSSPSSPPHSSPPSPPRTPEISPPPPSQSPPPPSQSPPPPGTPEVSPPPPSKSPPSTTFSPPPPSDVRVPPPPPSNRTTNSTSGNAPVVSSSSGNGGFGTGGVAAIGAVLGLVLLGVIGIAVCFVKRKKRNSRSNGGYFLPTSRMDSPQSDSGLLKVGASASRYASPSGNELVRSPSNRSMLGSSRTWFTYEELAEATNGFSEQNLLGEGGFGSVYKGYLLDGKEVAVKQLKMGGVQGEREFKAEVEIISRIHHRHLVSLVGYCIWESRRLLVYEYVPNNNLHFHLHGEGRPVMEWAMRVKIAAGAARGIAYLHEDCHPRVIHRDIKSSNILLDNNFEARVSDFGLAKLALDANTHVTTRVVGTFGYMAPEYASSGKLTEKSDVFSFGVVLLELITGRKPVDRSQPLGDESLVEWARPLLNQALETEEFEGLADPKLDKNYIDKEMLQMVEVAAACIRYSALKRPRMGQVVRAFESMVAADINNGVPVGDSEIYNTTPQSSEIQLFRRMAFGNQDFSLDFFSQNTNMNRSRSFAN